MCVSVVMAVRPASKKVADVGIVSSNKKVSSASLRDLCMEDKKKVAKLITQVAVSYSELRRYKEELDKGSESHASHVRQLKQEMEEARDSYESLIDRLELQNQEVAAEVSYLRTKLASSQSPIAHLQLPVDGRAPSLSPVAEADEPGREDTDSLLMSRTIEEGDFFERPESTKDRGNLTPTNTAGRRMRNHIQDGRKSQDVIAKVTKDEEPEFISHGRESSGEILDDTSKIDEAQNNLPKRPSPRPLPDSVRAFCSPLKTGDTTSVPLIEDAHTAQPKNSFSRTESIRLMSSQTIPPPLDSPTKVKSRVIATNEFLGESTEIADECSSGLQNLCLCSVCGPNGEDDALHCDNLEFTQCENIRLGLEAHCAQNQDAAAIQCKCKGGKRLRFDPTIGEEGIFYYQHDDDNRHCKDPSSPFPLIKMRDANCDREEEYITEGIDRELEMTASDTEGKVKSCKATRCSSTTEGPSVPVIEQKASVTEYNHDEKANSIENGRGRMTREKDGLIAEPRNEVFPVHKQKWASLTASSSEGYPKGYKSSSESDHQAHGSDWDAASSLERLPSSSKTSDGEIEILRVINETRDRVTPSIEGCTKCSKCSTVADPSLANISDNSPGFHPLEGCQNLCIECFAVSTIQKSMSMTKTTNSRCRTTGQIVETPIYLPRFHIERDCSSSAIESAFPQIERSAWEKQHERCYSQDHAKLQTNKYSMPHKPVSDGQNNVRQLPVNQRLRLGRDHCQNDRQVYQRSSLLRLVNEIEFDGMQCWARTNDYSVSTRSHFSNGETSKHRPASIIASRSQRRPQAIVRGFR